MKHDFITGLELDDKAVLALLALAQKMKAQPNDYAQALAGKSVVTLFEKQSLRTRLSFDIGINKLGGHAVYLDQQNGAMGNRESVKDFALNISTWADAIVARVNHHNTVQELAQFSSKPVVNSLCDLYHPCQALADFLTLQEVHGEVSELKLAYLGEGNNVTHSLMLLAATLGTDFVAVCPKGSGPDAQIVKQAEQIAASKGASVLVSDRVEAAVGANALYADTWVSMGDDTPLQQVKDKYLPYQLNKQLVDMTGAQTILHCQPAHREFEITSEVMDSPQAKIIQQAQNRMYAQNALLLTLLNPNFC
ncbi:MULTISPECIES: ornithine carbamoyltransferase [Pseudoalteromonas]|uniref:Ornithine carbamoyltransferase n=1 Tax=Pseudoalteromonas ruthenica TaxID=151081 RepID=A0A0F4Q2J6_9GAMM|nr:MULTISPECIES: ornithine carbamoyltransferase [Pseudoalteromonas]KJY97889.1 ornithine carbamoyltransferase [Pseudoalteromonas ruthenica]KJZ01916.1 ornithine carbamoyltransferase [Pseudoalteromonas ruthenica]MCG7567193.1 ornithine carbamoyltransferase [Pseudoalteromonas sp. CnMc7-15]QFU05811.1 Ornithine carbamoyltransferase [Pseudoalteromonas sp. THAF3]TMO48222.1 ornithine carbamoyltransferase [Pseudoalteromonas ruthenica]|tara:strand:+ start:466 stop:1386 length:921 start_codon:yes stop_codon:yes gene_type:complete